MTFFWPLKDAQHFGFECFSNRSLDVILILFLRTLTHLLLKLCSCLPDIVLSLFIQQSPASLLINLDQKETRLDCYHGDNNYPYMLWYQYKPAAGMQRTMSLIGLLHYENANLEKNFETDFNITGHSKGRAQLVISNIGAAHTAEYFCAAR